MKTIGYYQSQPSFRRRRATLHQLTRLSLALHGALWRETARGETLWLDSLADELRDLAAELDSIADDLDDIGPALARALDTERAA